MGTARGMIGEHEPLLYALSVEPRVARAGDVVRLCFRTRNLGARACAAGTVRFELAPGLEPIAQTAVEVGPAAPGDTLLATVEARIAAGLEDRSEVHAHAVLELPNAAFVTNEVWVTVRTRPHLDGAGSGTFVERVDADTVRVRAVVANEGDGPALGVRVRVRPPEGCARVDAHGDAVLDLPRIDAGDAMAVEMLARITEPIAVLRADDAEVCSADGARYALAVRTVLELAPAVAAPIVEVVAGRRHAEVRIDVRNDGWVDAYDVPVRCVLPRSVRVGLDRIVVDGALGLASRGGRSDAAVGSVRRASGGIEICVGRIAARTSARIVVPAALPVAGDAIAVSVAVGEHVSEATVAQAPVREVRVRVLDAPRRLAPGESAAIQVELVNAGDVNENVDVSLESSNDGAADVQTVSVRAGCTGRYRLTLPALRGQDGAIVPCAVVLRDAAGERARATFAVSVRDRAWLVLDALPVRRDEGVSYRVRNAGSTTARDVVGVVGEGSFPCGALAPGDHAILEMPAAEARCGGRVLVGGREALALPPLDDRLAAVVQSTLAVPPDVIAGAPLTIVLEIDVRDEVETLVVRAAEIAGAAYVPGSTTVDGAGILDRPDGGTVYGEGLVLRGIGAGTGIRIAWSMIAPANAERNALEVDAIIVVDDDPRPVAPARIAIREPDAFAARAPGVAYHIEARSATPQIVVPPPIPAAPAVVDDLLHEPPATTTTTATTIATGDDALTFVLRLEGQRLVDAARLLRATPETGIAAHMLLLRALFPEAETSGDVEVAAALERARDAVHDVFDRLYVKLRIPGFDVRAGDLEDVALRTALRELVARAADARAGDEEDEGVSVRVGRRRLRAALHACDEERYGAPAILRAILALVPHRCDDEPLLAAALGRYVRALDDALARWETGSREAFDDALAYGRDETLDDARTALLAAFRTRTALAGAAG